MIKPGMTVYYRDICNNMRFTVLESDGINFTATDTETYQQKTRAYENLQHGWELSQDDQHFLDLCINSERMKKPIENLTCCCCTNSTRGRQWWNRDIGFGLCKKCADWIVKDKRETPEGIKERYGVRGIHYAIEDGKA
jgi:hypothetical protein